MKCLFVLHDSGYRIEMFHFVHSSCGLSPWGCLILQTCPVFSTISIRLSVDFWSSGKTSHVRRLEQPMVITLLWRLRVTCFLSKVISQYQPPPPHTETTWIADFLGDWQVFAVDLWSSRLRFGFFRPAKSFFTPNTGDMLYNLVCLGNTPYAHTHTHKHNVQKLYFDEIAAFFDSHSMLPNNKLAGVCFCFMSNTYVFWSRSFMECHRQDFLFSIDFAVLICIGCETRQSWNHNFWNYHSVLKLHVHVTFSIICFGSMAEP